MYGPSFFSVRAQALWQGESAQDSFLRKCRDLIIRSVEFFPGRLLPSVCSSFSNVSTKFLTAFADPSSLVLCYVLLYLPGAGILKFYPLPGVHLYC